MVEVHPDLITYLKREFKVDVTSIDSMEELEYTKGQQELIKHLESLVEDDDGDMGDFSEVFK